MGVTDQLLTITEIAIALAGFAGIVASFQFSAGVPVSRGNVLGLAMMIKISLVTAVFAVLPLAIFNFQAGESLVWSISSGLYGLTYIVFFLFTIKRYRRVRISKGPSRLIFRFMGALLIFFAIVLILNSLNVMFHQEAGPYLVALIYSLSSSGYMFVRLVIRPLWRDVREREAAAQEGTA